jgi:hypothetical protein
MEEMRNEYKISVGIPEGKRPLGDLDVDVRLGIKKFFK